MSERVSVFRKARFNAAHRLYRPDWSDEKNTEVFGLCANPNWHGHNYDLIVKVTGEIDEVTGMVIDLKDLKALIETHVMKPFDHRNLNEDTEEFRSLIPTAENIAVVIWRKLRAVLDEKLDLQVRLYETPRNFVEYPHS